MNKIFAIKGHPTRGKEVIKILGMLGGNNEYHINDTECNLLYTIREGDDVIIGTYPNSGISQVYTLEEFLEKYPFKIGDKVQHKWSASDTDIYIVEDILWEDNQIKYIICNTHRKMHKSLAIAENLRLYKEDTYSRPDITIDGEKLIAPNGYTVKNATMNGNSLMVEYIKNKPQILIDDIIISKVFEEIDKKC